MCCLLAVSVFILRLTPSVGSSLNSWYLVLAFARASSGERLSQWMTLTLVSRTVQCVRLSTQSG